MMFRGRLLLRKRFRYIVGILSAVCLLRILLFTMSSTESDPSETSHQRKRVFNHFEQYEHLPKYEQRWIQASSAEKKYGRDKCGLHQLGLPKLVKRFGCYDDECQYLTCRELLFGNQTDKAYEVAQKWMYRNPVGLKPELALAESAQNCTRFLIEHDFNMTEPTADEREMSIAYNIIMHKDTQQVGRLISSIYRPSNTICIHIDSNAHPDVHVAMEAITKCLPNVFIASHLEQIVYAGYSRLQADFNCMKDLSRRNHPWRYLINLAGQAFPLKSNEELVRILKTYNGANDIEGIYGPGIIRNRFERQWQEIGADSKNPSLQRTGDFNEPPPHNMDVLKGSVYGVFSRAFVEWVLTDEVPRAFLDWSVKTWSPDEHYWASLHHTFTNPHLNPPGGYSGNPNGKPWLASYVSWQYADHCHGMFKRAVCIFGVGDLPTLVDAPQLFANKFYLDYQPLAFECMEDWIRFKNRCSPDFDLQFYATLPFIIGNNTKQGVNA